MRILLVDDDPIIREMLGRRLVQAGHDITFAADGSEALAILRARPFDLMLLDFMMPKKNGPEVLAEMDEIERFKRPRVLMLTSQRDTSDVIKALKNGADDYIVKPVAPSQVIDKVEALIN